MFERKPKSAICPLLRKPCILAECEWYTQLLGQHPQKDEVVDNSMCAMRALPLLLVENARQVRDGAAATESMRNEMARAIGAQVAGVGELVNLFHQAVHRPQVSTPLRSVRMPDGTCIAGAPVYDNLNREA